MCSLLTQRAALGVATDGEATTPPDISILVGLGSKSPHASGHWQASAVS